MSTLIGSVNILKILNPIWPAVQLRSTQPDSQFQNFKSLKSGNQGIRASGHQGIDMYKPLHVGLSQHWPKSHRLNNAKATLQRLWHSRWALLTSSAPPHLRALLECNGQPRKPRKTIISSLSVHPSAQDAEKCPRPAGRHFRTNWPRGKDQRTYLL